MAPHTSCVRACLQHRGAFHTERRICRGCTTCLFVESRARRRVCAGGCVGVWGTDFAQPSSDAPSSEIPFGSRSPRSGAWGAGEEDHAPLCTSTARSTADRRWIDGMTDGRRPSRTLFFCDRRSCGQAGHTREESPPCHVTLSHIHCCQKRKPLYPTTVRPHAIYVPRRTLVEWLTGTGVACQRHPISADAWRRSSAG